MALVKTSKIARAAPQAGEASVLSPCEPFRAQLASPRPVDSPKVAATGTTDYPENSFNKGDRMLPPRTDCALRGEIKYVRRPKGKVALG